MKMSDHFNLPLPAGIFVLGSRAHICRKGSAIKCDAAATHAVNIHDDLVDFIRSLVDDSQLELGFREQAEVLLQRAGGTP